MADHVARANALLASATESIGGPCEQMLELAIVARAPVPCDPAAPAGRVDDIVGAVLLASRAGPWMTGQSIIIDGGTLA